MLGVVARTFKIDLDVFFSLREKDPADRKLLDIKQVEVCKLLKVVKKSGDVTRCLVVEEPQLNDDLEELNQAPD